MGALGGGDVSLGLTDHAVDPTLLAWHSRKLLLGHRLAPHTVFVLIGITMGACVLMLWPEDSISARDVAAITCVVVLTLVLQRFLPVVAMRPAPGSNSGSFAGTFSIQGPPVLLLAIATDVRSVLIQSVAMVVLTRLLWRRDPTATFHPARLLWYPMADAFCACMLAVLVNTVFDIPWAWAAAVPLAVVVNEIYLQLVGDAIDLVSHYPPYSGLCTDWLLTALPCAAVVLALAPW